MKLIAIDLDGTLLNNESKISKKNLEAIKYAQSIGIEVVIATGRAQFDVKKIFEETGIQTWVIGANGATIHQPTGELFHAVPMKDQHVNEILEWLDQETFHYEIFSKNAIFTPQNGRELLETEMHRAKSVNPGIDREELQTAVQRQFSQEGFSLIRSYRDVLEMDTDIYNILAFSFEEEKLKKGWKKFGSRQDLTMVSSSKYNFELEHKDASKGIALQSLADKLNIRLENTAAVGDSFNDLSMLKIAGRSAAMGNAVQEIKNETDEVTLTNDEDGVAHFIEALIKNVPLNIKG